MRLSIVAILMLMASSAFAQGADNARAGVGRWGIPKAAAPLASAVLPGAGQFLEGRDRSIAYIALEVVTWWKLSRDVNDRSDQITEFKDLARRVARAHFSPNGPDGDWRYYEMMRDFNKSGDYSKSDVTVVPETDTSTFNGHVWRFDLATSEDQAEALEKYKQQAYKPEMLWSWENAGIHWNLYKRSTERRNDANTAVNADIAVLVLNHLISMVDAYSAFRLDTRHLPDGRTAIGGRLSW